MITFAKSKFYITTPIYYVNDVAHIGHAYTTIAADVLARWHRSLGEDVFFLTGTDEHGKKVQQIAEKKGKTPQKFVDEISGAFKKAWKALNIEYDGFLRTTDVAHVKAVQKALQELYDKKFIYKGKYKAYYCVGCEQYKTKLDLVDGKCPDHLTEPELRSDDAYLFKLSAFQGKLKTLIEKDEFKISPPEKKNEILSFLEKEELRDISISRPKSEVYWGIELPFDKNHTCYVWMDAFLNYLTGLGWPSGAKFRKFWPADVQLMSKDIIRVHATIWPAELLSLGIKLPKQIFVHGYFTVDGQKMSKSLGNVVDPVKISERYGVDIFRYHLLREVPFGEDGDFSEKALINRINTDLANSLGNLLSRTLTLIEKFSDGKVPKGSSVSSDLDLQFADKFRHASKHLENFEFHHALERIWDFVNHVNKHINDEKPWELAKDPKLKSKLYNVLYNCSESLRLISALIWPFMPETADTIAKQLGLKEAPKLKGIKFGGLKPGTAIKKGNILFKKIEFKEEAKEPFAKLDIRCAKILDVEDIEGADKLYKLHVDLGKLGKRTVVAGIKKYYSKEQLKGKKIALLANLEHATIRNVKSEGMILAAQDGSTVEALLLEKTGAGESIFAKGVKPEPPKVLPYDEFAKVSITVSNGTVISNGKPLQSDQEPIKVKLKQGIVK
ncbi:MAG: methionine--tRNA ligase [archaeon]